MADLFTSLTLAARSLEAQRVGLQVTGQNIANVNTPGYTRRVVDFAAVPPTSRDSAGGGVTATDIRSQRDALLERRVEQETTAAEREASLADALGVAELALGAPGASIDERLSEFFDSFARLADSPTSTVARQEVALQGANLASAIRGTADRLAAARQEANARVGATVEEINALASRISALNESIAAEGVGSAGLHLADEQGELVRQLAGLTDIRVLARPGGGVDIDIAGGHPLVVGNTAYSLEGTPSGPDGILQITVDGADITQEISSGELGGLLIARDSRIPEYIARLDEQAFELAETINTIHADGFDLDGNTGQDFFAFTSAITGPAGAASALVLDAAIAADPRRIAAADTAVPGGNAVARELADARDLRVLDGGTATLNEAWGALVFRVGRDVQAARQESATLGDVVRQVETLRDQVSGVSLDEEAVQLLKFQRAFEANARFFSVIDQTLDTLFNAFTR